MSEDDDHAYVIGNMMMNLDDNIADGGVDELEMITVEDLSSNDLFTGKHSSTLNDDSPVEVSNCDADLSMNEEDDECEDIDECELSESIVTETLSSHKKLSFSSPSADIVRVMKFPKVDSLGQEDNGIDQFNHILSLKLSRTSDNLRNDKDEIAKHIDDEQLYREEAGCIAGKVSEGDSIVIDNNLNQLSNFDQINHCASDLAQNLASTSIDTFESSESPSSSLQDITIMKEEMVDNMSDSEEIMDKTINETTVDIPFMLKVTNKERINSAIRRRRPVIHRKCKINGEKDVGKLFKTKYIARSLMKYRPMRDSNGLQKFVTFQCEKCEYSTNNRSNYKNHLLIHGDARLYQCPFCPYKSKQSAGLRAHYKVHSVEKPFACSFCHYKSKRKQNLVQHLKIHAKEKPFRCEECPFQGSTKQLLQNHVLWHITRNQRKQRKSSEGANHECLLCNITFPTEDDLAEHYESHADENTVSSSQEVGISDKNVHRKLERANIAFKCSQCDFLTLRKCAFRNHVKSHNKNIQKCDQCSFKCDLQSKLTAHMESHNIKESTTECSHSDFKSLDEKELSDHFDESHQKSGDSQNESLETEEFEKPSSLLIKSAEYGCPFCKFTCFMGEILKVHICNHTNNDLQMYRTRDCVANDLNNANIPIPLQMESRPLENESTNSSFSSIHRPVHVAEGRSEWNLKYDGVSLPSKRSFNGNLLHPINTHNESASESRQPSYATYGQNYESVSDSTYTSNETKFEPIMKRLKPFAEETHNNLHDSGCNCSSSLDDCNDDMEYESVNVVGAVASNPSGSLANFSGNDAYDKALIGMVDNPDFHSPLTPVNTSQYQHNDENDLNSESFRILLHVLENASFDGKVKTGPVQNYMSNNAVYEKFNTGCNMPRQEFVRHMNYPVADSYSPISNYTVCSKDENTLPVTVNDSNICIPQNVSDAVIPESQHIPERDQTWKPLDIDSEILDIAPSANGYFINSGLDDMPLSNNERGHIHHMENNEPVPGDGTHCRNDDASISSFPTKRPVADENYIWEKPSSSSGENTSSMHSTPKDVAESFDKKFEIYALGDQNKLEPSVPGATDSDDKHAVGVNEMPLNTYTMKCEPTNDSCNENEADIYNCNKCEASFIKKSSLTNHYRIHTSKFYFCPSCPYKTRCKSSLQAHSKKHSKESIFRCVQCDFTTKRKCSLISHYRAHTQLYICSYCGFQCRLIRELEAHSAIHNDGMSIKCMFCNFTTSKHKMLKYHMKKHTSNPLFKCTRCSFGFQTEEEYNCHLDAHQAIDKQKYFTAEDKEATNPVKMKISN